MFVICSNCLTDKANGQSHMKISNDSKHKTAVKNYKNRPELNIMWCFGDVETRCSVNRMFYTYVNIMNIKTWLLDLRNLISQSDIIVLLFLLSFTNVTSILTQRKSKKKKQKQSQHIFFCVFELFRLFYVLLWVCYHVHCMPEQLRTHVYDTLIHVFSLNLVKDNLIW